jgi:hypothetical protein
LHIGNLSAQVKKKPDKKIEAAEAPMCRLCETRHWSQQPHHFKPTEKEKPKRDRDD